MFAAKSYANGVVMDFGEPILTYPVDTAAGEEDPDSK